MMNGHKTCSNCGRRRKRTNFYRNPRSRDGLDRRCKDCVNGTYRKPEDRERFQAKRPNPKTEASMVKVWRSGVDKLMPWQVDVQGYQVARFGTQAQACKAAHVMFEYLTDGIVDRPLNDSGRLSMTATAVQKRAERARRLAA